MKWNKQYLLAISTLMGTIIGVGMFGIPYAVLRSGVVWGIIHLVFLTIITVFVHLYYGEVTLRTPGKHRFVGYAEMYLGGWGKWAAFFITVFGLLGSLLAYIIVAGKFLFLMFNPFFGGTEFLYSAIFFLGGSFVVAAGLRAVARWEFAMTVLLFLAAAFLFFKGLPAIEWNHFRIGDGEPFLPFGVILFSLGGMTAILELEDLLTRKKELMKSVIVWGTILPAVFYFLFTFVVLGVSGGGTTPESIAGLVPVLGSGVGYIGAVFGFLAVATSFFVIGQNLSATLEYDLRFPKIFSWLLACGFPFVLFLLGFRAFIPVVDIVGLVLGGLTGILTVFLWRAARKRGKDIPAYALRERLWVDAGILLVFGGAIVYELFRFFL